MNKLKTTRAFTLLEMLLIIAIIAILAGIVIVAINPGRQLAQSRNAQRASDLRAIHSAVNQYYIDNKEWPGDLETYTTLTEICDTGTEPEGHSIDCAADGLIDLSSLVPTYISEIPTDPQVTASLPFTKTAHAQTTNGTGYEIALDTTTQMVMLNAPNSVEYGLEPVQLGTTVLSDADYSCNDLYNVDCWYTNEDVKLWSDVKVITNATSTSDGFLNTSILVNLPNSYPAAEYCYNLTEGGVPPGTWYLPASNQIASAYTFLKNNGVTQSGAYWTSTENSIDSSFRLVPTASSFYLGTNSKIAPYGYHRIICFH